MQSSEGHDFARIKKTVANGTL